jgi:hypothetical protein
VNLGLDHHAHCTALGHKGAEERDAAEVCCDLLVGVLASFVLALSAWSP